MKVSVTIFVILISTCIVNASVLDPVIENVVHLKASTPPSGVPGIWKKKTIWKPRWVKEWKSAKVMKPVWRKVWSPIQIKEWVPIPKPPPGWDSVSTPLKPVTSKPILVSPKKNHPKKHIPQVVQQKLPLWDPVPYPESQQPPPPPPFPHVPVAPPPPLPFYPPCGEYGCGDPPTFNQQQISEIISSHKHKKSVDNYQSPEYSETVTHLTRVPPNGNNRPQFQQTNFFGGGRFNFPELSPFLVPPKFRPLPNNNFLNFQFRNQNIQNFNKNIPNSNVQITRSPGFEINPVQNNGLKPWNPLPPQNNHNNHNVNNNNHDNNNIRGHFITQAPDNHFKFRLPETTIRPSLNTPINLNNLDQKLVPNKESSEKQNLKTQSTSRPVIDSDFIQQAELVGEYHYSDFDLTKNPKSEQKKTDEQKPKPVLKKIQPQEQKTSNLQDPKRNTPVEVENKPRQVRTDSAPSSRSPTAKEEIKPDPKAPKPNFQQEKKPEENFPVYKTTESINPAIIQSKHRFSTPTGTKPLDEPSQQNLDPSKHLIQTETFFHLQPFSSQPKESATTKFNPAELANHLNSNDFTETLTPETTTPFTVYSSSSFPSTSESETDGPVFIVTPSYTIKT